VKPGANACPIGHAQDSFPVRRIMLRLATDRLIRTTLVTLVSVLLCACAGWPGGSDPVGLKAKADVESVIEAAKAYRAQFGAYPKSLDLLVPAFIPSLPSHVTLQYNPSTGVVGFLYSPSIAWGRVAKCTTDMETVEWACIDYTYTL
jgi:hypothetical protein